MRVLEEEGFSVMASSLGGKRGVKLRRVRVMFQDIPTYPHEIVKKVIENFESEDIQRSLVGYDPTFTETFLSLLPTKKALMIQNDLFHMTEFPPISQCAESRRKICQKIESEFELQRFSLEEHWKNTNYEPAMTEDNFQAEEVGEEISLPVREAAPRPHKEKFAAPETFVEAQEDLTQELLRPKLTATPDAKPGTGLDAAAGDDEEKPFDLTPGEDDDKYKAA